MKYEAVFGDERLFDGAGLFTGIDIVTRSVDDGLYRTSRLSDETSDSIKKNPIVAMRRIIAEPKRWTVADQKAGRLPEVGCKVATVNGKCVIIGVDLNPKFFAVQYQYPDDVSMDILHISKIMPIETPEEKERRARKEWCIKALSSCSILSGMQKYELKRLGGYIEDIYDALLSGELPMPAAPEQNK